MTKDNKLLATDALLIAACVYGFVGGNIQDKKFAMVALVLYIASGVFSLANEFTSDSVINKCDDNAYFISNVCGLDLIMVDICLMSNVEQKFALIPLIFPAIDLIATYIVDDSWSPVTPYSHIGCIAGMCVFAFRDTKYILIVSGIGFLFAIFGNKNDRKYWVNGFNSLGIFSASWFLAGKDLKDMGIPIE